MSYFIFKSSDPSTPFTIINEQTVDNTSASLSFVGRRRVDYGQSQQQNQLWLLENFAASSPPSNPIAGQLWYDTSVEYMKVFDGGTWTRVSNSFAGTSSPTNPELGQFFFNTASQKLTIYNGTEFLEIGPSDDAIPFSIVFGS